MSDSKFAFWTSSIFLIPLIPQVLVLFFWIISKILNTSLEPSAIPYALKVLMWTGGMFFVSYTLEKYTFYLGRKKSASVKHLVNIFLSPLLFVIWGIYDVFKGYPFSESSEAGLGLLMILPTLVFMFFVFLCYYFLIRNRALNIGVK